MVKIYSYEDWDERSVTHFSVKCEYLYNEQLAAEVSQTALDDYNNALLISEEARKLLNNAKHKLLDEIRAYENCKKAEEESAKQIELLRSSVNVSRATKVSFLKERGWTQTDTSMFSKNDMSMKMHEAFNQELSNEVNNEW